jgi:hypothetical protein
MLDASAVNGGFAVPGAQTLSGNGSVNGNVFINGTLSPGASIGGLTFAGNLTLGGVTFMEINKAGGALTNDWAASTGSLTYGGSLIVTNTGGFLVAGDTFQLFSAATFAGAFNTMTLTPLAPGLHWATSQLLVNGTLSIVGATGPQLMPIAVSGTNLLISLQSELGASYVLESATNLDTPIAWTPVSTNGGIGAMLTIPAPFDATQPQSYFRVVTY